MASSFENKLEELRARLKAENDSEKKDITLRELNIGSPNPRKPKPLNMPGNFTLQSAGPGGANSSYGSPSRSAAKRPGLGNFGGMRRRNNFQLPCSPQPQKPPDRNSISYRQRKFFTYPYSYDEQNAEIEAKYQEIMRQAGILTLDGQKIPTDIADLEPLGELGHGTCGHVVKMRHRRTGHIMAVKQMRRSGNKEENKRIIMDLDVVLKSYNCPYIVMCYGTIITHSEVWICMELMATCLDKLLKRTTAQLPEKILGKITVATVKALNYLKEEHGVIHRDVKPSNILLDERGRIKLCDFGISGRLVDSKAKTRSAGCAAYMAPERIDPPDPTKPDYDIRADVWSLGISLVELATGVFPYKNCKTDFDVLAKILQEDPPLLPPGQGFSMDFCGFVRDCLTKDYEKRPKYKKLLQHNFVVRYERIHVDVAAWYAQTTGSYKGFLSPPPVQTVPQFDAGKLPVAQSCPGSLATLGYSPYSPTRPTRQLSASSNDSDSLSYINPDLQDLAPPVPPRTRSQPNFGGLENSRSPDNSSMSDTSSSPSPARLMSSPQFMTSPPYQTSPNNFMAGMSASMTSMTSPSQYSSSSSVMSQSYSGTGNVMSPAHRTTSPSPLFMNSQQHQRYNTSFVLSPPQTMTPPLSSMTTPPMQCLTPPPHSRIPPPSAFPSQPLTAPPSFTSPNNNSQINGHSMSMSSSNNPFIFM